MSKSKVFIRMYGAFTCSISDPGNVLPLTGKTAALLALLASAPDGRRTKTWLQEMLWPRSGEHHGRASLRQSLTKLRRTFGASFLAIIESNNQDVWLKLDAVEFLGTPQDGALLEGLDLTGADGFERWLAQQRLRIVAGLEATHKTDLRSAFPVVRPQGGLARVEYDLPKLRPAIAILPFAHYSADPTQVNFGDMIAGDLSRLIARSHGIDVISHMSCRMPGFYDTDLVRLREEFGVDFLVSGFLRSNSDSLRLELEFTDSSTGIIINSQTFSRPKLDWLEGGNDVLHEIAAYIVDSLFKGAIRNSGSRPMNNLDAHTLLMSAIALMHRQDLASLLKSRQFLENIVERFGPSSLPFAWQAQWFVLFLAQNWSTDADADKASARLMVDRARDADPECNFSQIMDGVVSYQLERNYDFARVAFDDVLAKDENNALAWYWQGTMLAFQGFGKEAVAYTERGRFLTPLDPGGYLYNTLSATAYLANQDHREALLLANKALAQNRHHASALRSKIVALNGLGRLDEARGAAELLHKMYPNFSIAGYLSTHPAAEFQMGREWARVLESSGIPSG